MSKKSPQKSTKKKKQERTKIAQATFIKKYLKTSNITKACQEANIDRGTYYNWMEEETFKKKFENATEAWGDAVEDGLRYYTDKKNLDALKFVATRKFKDRGYSEKKEVEHSGKLKVDRFAALLEEVNEEKEDD